MTGLGVLDDPAQDRVGRAEFARLVEEGPRAEPKRRGLLMPAECLGPVRAPGLQGAGVIGIAEGRVPFGECMPGVGVLTGLGLLQGTRQAQHGPPAFRLALISQRPGQAECLRLGLRPRLPRECRPLGQPNLEGEHIPGDRFDFRRLQGPECLIELLLSHEERDSRFEQALGRRRGGGFRCRFPCRPRRDRVPEPDVELAAEQVREPLQRLLGGGRSFQDPQRLLFAAPTLLRSLAVEFRPIGQRPSQAKSDVLRSHIHRPWSIGLQRPQPTDDRIKDLHRPFA
jgi:hypothetical protein